MDSATEVEVRGHVALGYEPVREAFQRNFAEFGDLGASLAVYEGGKCRVDLSAGVADVETGRPWADDTLCLVYSVTKGATAIVVHRLGAQGVLDLDAPVCEIWPEFARNGKQDITTRMLLSHQAGLPAIEKILSREELLAGSPVAAALAEQRPLWEPGSAHGYHALTYGWLLGEVVKRVSGRSVGELFRSEVAEPLELDFYIGLPSSERGRVAKLLPAPAMEPGAIEAIADVDLRQALVARIAEMADPRSVISRALSSNGALPTPDASVWNDPDIYAAEIPAANGIADARSIARMYAACIGEVDGVRILREETVEAATREQSSGTDQVIGVQNRFGSGFMLNSMGSVLPGEQAFGHYGAGGALGYADRATGLALGYVPSRSSNSLTGDPRAVCLMASLEQVKA